MVQKLTKVGDGAAVVVDPALLAQLQIGPDTPLRVSVEGRRLIVEPAGDAPPADLRGALEAVNAAHGATLRRLAE